MRSIIVSVIVQFAIHSFVSAQERLPLETQILLRKLADWEDGEKTTLDRAIQKKRGEVALALMGHLKKTTQSGDLKTANLIQGEIDRLRNIKPLRPKKITVTPVEQGTSDIAVISKSGLPGKVLPLVADAPIYANRDYAWLDIPRKLRGCSYHQVQMRGVEDLKVKVNVAGILYCAFTRHQDSHKEKMQEMLDDGWEKESFEIKTSGAQGDYIVLSKQSKKGSIVIPPVHPACGTIVIFSERKQ